MHAKALLQSLRKVGVCEGDLLFMHTDLRPFGLPQNCVTNEQILQFYLNIFQEAVGAEGTLAAPAFFYEYGRYGESFDVESSPVSKPLGVFSSFFNSLEGRVRSLSPMQSIAALGRLAPELCGGQSLAGYGISSPWHRLRQMKGKILFLGTSIQPMTYVHHIEQQFGVPHLYTKIYPYPVLKHGKAVPGQVTSSVRYLDYEIMYDLLNFQKELAKQKVLHTIELNKAPIHCVGAEEAFQVGISLLQKNPYIFLKQPPAFVPGKIPIDGLTGKTA